jgi:HAD superfamily hydrolase (TIGR01509 family)
MPHRPDQLPAPAGIAFDLDGTLVDTVGARIDGWLEALAAAGMHATRDEVAPMIGMDGKRLARAVAEANGRRLADDELEEIDRAAGEAFDRLNTSPRPLPGAGDLLGAIGARGLRWLIATSSRAEQVTRSVAALGLAAPPTIVDGSQVKRAKPAPDLLLLAADRLVAPADRCWAVGDATWDIRASRAAGIPAIGVLAGSAVDRSALEEAGAALVVETLIELVALLDGVGGH